MSQVKQSTDSGFIFNTAEVRLRTCNLRRIDDTCAFTVLSENNDVALSDPALQDAHPSGIRILLRGGGNLTSDDIITL